MSRLVTIAPYLHDDGCYRLYVGGKFLGHVVALGAHWVADYPVKAEHTNSFHNTDLVYHDGGDPMFSSLLSACRALIKQAKGSGSAVVPSEGRPTVEMPAVKVPTRNDYVERHERLMALREEMTTTREGLPTVEDIAQTLPDKVTNNS